MRRCSGRGPRRARVHRPVAVKGAQPGDVLEVRILDVNPSPCANPKYGRF